MFGKMPQQAFQRGLNIRSQPYPGQDGQVLDQQTALEQLLRTVAEKASQMEAKDIMTLTNAFTAAANTADSQSSFGGSASATSLLDASQIRDITCNNIAVEAMQRHGVGGLGASGFTIDGAAGMTLDPLQQQLILQQQQQQQQQQQLQQQQHRLSLPTLADVVGSLQTVKVSAKTNVKAIAGAMSKALRSCEAFVATSVGPEGVNHSMKALCISRCYLAAEGLDLTATVTEVQPDAGISIGQCYAFTVVRMAVQAKPGPLASAGVGRTEPQVRFSRPPGHQTDMKVAGGGTAGPVGGAIAKCLREDREIIITSVGPASVAKCVEAMVLARNAIKSDGIELFFFPGFEEIIMTGPGAGEQRSCVRVHVWPEQAMAPFGGGEPAAVELTTNEPAL